MFFDLSSLFFLIPRNFFPVSLCLISIVVNTRKCRNRFPETNSIEINETLNYWLNGIFYNIALEKQFLIRDGIASRVIDKGGHGPHWLLNICV